MAQREVERTEDGRYIVVDGRRWRATDPTVPGRFESELVSELMAARRAVGAAGDEESERAARDRVQDAKVALGERGQPWWEEPQPDALRVRLAATARTLLRHRDATSSICPSDAARVVGGDSWRDIMPLAREVAAALAADGVVDVTSGEQRVSSPTDPSTWDGPVRLRRGPSFDGADC